MVRHLVHQKPILTYKNLGRVLRSLNNQLLDEPVAYLKTHMYGDRAYSVLRNKTLDIRKTSSVTLFKTKLKTYLLRTPLIIYLFIGI